MSEIEEDKIKASRLFNPKAIKKGALVFISLSLLTFIGIFFYTNTGKTVNVWGQVDWRYFLIGIVFIFNDLYIGAWRNHLFVRELQPKVPLLVSVKANLANIFMGAVTPSQSGGGPSQWYIYHRNGVPLGDSVGISFYNWMSTIVFFPLTGALAIYILKDKIPDGFVMHLTKFGFSIFTTLFIVIFLAIFMPRILDAIILLIARIVGSVKESWKNKLETASTSGLGKLKEYRERYLGLIIQKPYLMVVSFLLTIVLYANKYILAYVFILGFGLEADFWSVIAIAAVVYLLLYFAPGPGGSGIAELSFTGLLAALIPEEAAMSVTLAHRSFLVFIPTLLGAWVVMKQLAKET